VSIFQDIQDYAREKALAYDVLTKVPESAQTETPYASALSFEDVEKLLGEPRTSKVFERLMDEDSEVPKAGAVSFFEEEEEEA
jgi:hypothetical protein